MNKIINKYWGLTIIGVLVIVFGLGIISKYNEWQAEKIASEKSSFKDLVGEDPKAGRIYSSGNTALHIAAKHGLTELMQWLIDDRANVNARNGSRKTPLLLAAEEGHSEVVKFLLKRDDTNVNARDNYDQTSLHWAINHSNSEMVRSLLERGANVNARDNYGKTPLDLAIQYGVDDDAKVLRDNGGKCNRRC